ncbi:hypothetical protein N0V85_008418, partial [Neurospora sp. IMI 360204]
ETKNGRVVMSPGATGNSMPSKDTSDDLGVGKSSVHLPTYAALPLADDQNGGQVEQSESSEMGLKQTMTPTDQRFEVNGVSSPRAYQEPRNFHPSFSCLHDPTSEDVVMDSLISAVDNSDYPLWPLTGERPPSRWSTFMTSVDSKNPVACSQLYDMISDELKRACFQHEKMVASSNRLTSQRRVPNTPGRRSVLRGKSGFGGGNMNLANAVSDSKCPKALDGNNITTDNSSVQEHLVTGTIDVKPFVVSSSNRFVDQMSLSKKPGIGAKRVLQGFSTLKTCAGHDSDEERNTLPASHANVELKRPSQPEPIQPGARKCIDHLIPRPSGTLRRLIQWRHARGIWCCSGCIWRRAPKRNTLCERCDEKRKARKGDGADDAKTEVASGSAGTEVDEPLPSKVSKTSKKGETAGSGILDGSHKVAKGRVGKKKTQAKK